MATAETQVRLALPAEAGAIGEVQLAAWRVSYDGLLPAEVLDALEPDRFAETWRAALLVLLVVRAAAVAGGDVQQVAVHGSRAEEERAAVVVELRLLDGEDHAAGGRCQGRPGQRVRRGVGHDPLPHRRQVVGLLVRGPGSTRDGLGGHGVEKAVAGVPRVERSAQEAAFVGVGDEGHQQR